MNITPDKIKELLQMTSDYYLNNFYAFVKDVFFEWKQVPFKMHYTTQYVCEYLQLCAEGEIERLLVSLPRGWGKSIIITEAFPIWLLLRDSSERIGCYTKSLNEDAKIWHDNSKMLLNTNFVNTLFPNRVALKGDSTIIFRTTANGYRRVGSCLSSSVGSDLTFAIIDDPADQEHYRSEAKQQRLENFFKKALLRAIRVVKYYNEDDIESEAYVSQLTPEQRAEYKLTQELEKEALKQGLPQKKPRMVLTMQRLSVNDPINMFLDINEKMIKQGLQTSFKYISIPAIHTEETIYKMPIFGEVYIAKEGEYTLAGTLSRQSILQAKADMSEADFEAQMQQNPIVSESQLIKASYFSYYNQEMLSKVHFNQIFLTLDTATKTKEANDFSVMCCWGTEGLGQNRKVWLLDMIRGKWEFDTTNTLFKNFYYKWQRGLNGKGVGCNKIIIEDASAGTQLIQSYKKEFPSYLVKPLKRVNDKFTRYTSIARYVERGCVFLPSDDVLINGISNTRDIITEPFLKECVAFTSNDTHKHDDIVDNLIDACTETFLENPSLMDTLTSNVF